MEGIIDRIDFNTTTHGQRDLDAARLSNLIEKISEKRRGLADVESDIIGRGYEYLIRKFIRGLGLVRRRVLHPEGGRHGHDPRAGHDHLRSVLRNYIPEDDIERIASTFLTGKKRTSSAALWTRPRSSKTTTTSHLSRYIHTGESATSRPIAEIVTELDAIEAEAWETDAELKKILKQLGGRGAGDPALR